MVKMNRFIQFNDETVDTKTLLLYERLARALSDANYLELTERKLIEFRPQEGAISMSVFWRHRSEEVMDAGRRSDIYLLTAGFWKHFSMHIWEEFAKEVQSHPLRNFSLALLLLFEEFRLTDIITKERPGTTSAFAVRREAYVAWHQQSVHANIQKGFLADGLLNEIFIIVYEGLFAASDIVWGEIQFDRIQSSLERVYDAKSTEDNAFIVHQILTIIGEEIPNDLLHQYYAVGNSFIEQIKPFSYHDGMTDADDGEEDIKETIEEVFRAWHEENEDEAGIHLQYELEHGRSGKTAGVEGTAGNEGAEIEEVGIDHSEANESDQDADDERNDGERQEQAKKAGRMYGKEHINVVYEEQRIVIVDGEENRQKLVHWRDVQKPYVRSFVEEMKKRIDLKQNTKRERLMNGRLSTKLTTLVLDERPKPFYRKNAPSIHLDAVFGLLVDGSASMLDKLDETKKAVLLFHDVLRELNVKHEISTYYEDAFKASAEVQPNHFEFMHTFLDRNYDNGQSILSFDAHEDNRDGFAIRWMADRLQMQQEKHKFLLVFSDGEPSAFGYDRNGILDTAEAVMEAENKGISVIHLFLSTEEPSSDQKELFAMMFGNKTASSNTVEGFTEQTLRILRKLLSIVIRTN